MATGAGLSESETGPFVFICLGSIVAFWLMYRLLKHSIVVVQQASVMIVERFGNFHRVLKPGWHFLWPIMDSPRELKWRAMCGQQDKDVATTFTTDRIDLREHVIDFGRQHVITQDTVEMYIDALVYFRVVDARLAVLEVQNLPDSIELLTQASLRNIISTMTLDDTFSSREKINRQLLLKMKEDAERWGVTITRVEIFNLDPTGDVKVAMESQIKAERERRAMVLQADGIRQSQIIRSRGDAARLIFDAVGKSKAIVNESKGKSDQKTFGAEAQAKSLEYIKSSLVDTDVRAVDYLTAIQYFKSLSSINGQNTHAILVPTKTVDDVGMLMGEKSRIQ
jgi:regulator of protease activity HflC (stomatin/prohibitin superfamily)